MIAVLALLAVQADGSADLEGHVLKSFTDGPRTMVTVAIGSITSFGDPTERTFFMDGTTRIEYRDLPRSKRRPAPGLVVRGWLARGSRDLLKRAVFSPPGPPPAVKLPEADGRAITVEAEDLTPHAVEIAPLDGASGGKAVLFRNAEGRAAKDIPLRRSVYEVTVVMTGRNTYHDAVFVAIDRQRRRWFQEQRGTLAPAATRDGRPVYVDIPTDGPHRVELTFAESDVWVDRIVLTPVSLRSEADRPARPDEEGWFRDWLVLAPIPAIDGLPTERQVDGSHLDEEGRLRPLEGALSGRRGDRHVWTAVRAGKGTLDLDALLGGRANRRPGAVAYAVCSVWSEHARENLCLHAGSDGPLKLFLNGSQILRYVGNRDFEVDENRVDGITLRRGENLIVLKLISEGSGWRGRVRFTSGDGRPVTALRVVFPAPAP